VPLVKKTKAILKRAGPLVWDAGRVPGLLLYHPSPDGDCQWPLRVVEWRAVLASHAAIWSGGTMPWRKIAFTRRQWERIHSDRSGAEGKARFLIDEDMPWEVTSVLRKRHYGTMTVEDYGFTGRGDQAIFTLARSEDRILVTEDQGFFDDARFPVAGSPGVAILPSHADSEEGFINAFGVLLKIHGDCHALWRETKAWIAGDGTVAIRCRNPVGGGWTTMKYLFPDDGSPMVWEDE